MEFYICWIAIEELKLDQKDFKIAMTNLMLYLLARKESTIKL